MVKRRREKARSWDPSFVANAKRMRANGMSELAIARQLHRSRKTVRLHVDHVEPFKAGGPTGIENLRTACSECSLGKGTTRL